jgi:hypothetical protein
MATFAGSTTEIDVTLSVCNATLTELKQKMRGDYRKSAKKLSHRISRRRRPISKDEAYDIYRELLALVQMATHLSRDLEWSS